MYGDDPVAVARAFAAAGAAWVHVVDLDAARRTGSNRDAVLAVAGAVSVPVQSGGGVRDGSLLAAGVTRIVVGSVAIEQPGLVADLALTHPGQVAVGLDHRGGEVRTRGWEEGSGLDVFDVVDDFSSVPGIAAFVVTDIARDGVLAGSDVAGYERLVAATAVPVIASGGVGSLDDLRALRDTGVAGVIVGKALYDGRFTVAEALDASAGL